MWRDNLTLDYRSTYIFSKNETAENIFMIRGTPQNHGPQTWFLPQRVGDSSDPSTQLSSLSQVHSSGIHVPFPQWNSLERQLGVRWGVNLKTSSLSHIMCRSTYIFNALQMANAYTHVPINKHEYNFISWFIVFKYIYLHYKWFKKIVLIYLYELIKCKNLRT